MASHGAVPHPEHASSGLARPAQAAFASLLLFLGGAAGVVAQEASPGRWHLEAGIGPGILVSGHDRSRGGQWSPAARAGIGRTVGSSLGWTVEWAGAWPASRVAGGRERRHHVGVGLEVRPGEGPLAIRGSVGFALSTVIEQDGPPEPPNMGDVVISVGETMGLSLLAGVARPIRAGPVTLVPRLDGLVQRVHGHTLSHLLLTASVRLGG